MTKDELTTAVEDSLIADFNSRAVVKRATVQMDIINDSFKDKVNNYGLVLYGSSMIDEDEDEEEKEMGEDNAKWGLCRWFPRPSEGFEYYDVDAWAAKKVKVTFKRTKKTCNNIIYHVCEYLTTNSVASCHLKHPGDEETYGPYNWDGITLLYKRYKNQTPTYTFYYD